MTQPAPAPRSASLPGWVVPVAVGCGALIVAGVVIVVLGIAASIALPQFITVRDRARDVAARSELGRVIVAQEVHRMDHGVYTLYLEDLTFEDDPAVKTTILFAHDAGYEICSQHLESESSWWVHGVGEEMVRSWASC